MVYNQSGNYPTVNVQRRHPLYVDFVAGWPDAAGVPAIVASAILLLAGHYYQQREAFHEGTLTETPCGWTDVVNLFRTGLEWSA